MMHIDDFLADGQAQSRAAGTAVGLAALYELAEDAFQFIFGNSDAGIADFNLNRRDGAFVLGASAVVHEGGRHPYCDLAAGWRDLDGVGKQVAQNLSNAERVHFHGCGITCRRLKLERDFPRIDQGLEFSRGLMQ